MRPRMSRASGVTENAISTPRFGTAVGQPPFGVVVLIMSLLYRCAEVVGVDHDAAPPLVCSEGERAGHNRPGVLACLLLWIRHRSSPCRHWMNRRGGAYALSPSNFFARRRSSAICALLSAMSEPNCTGPRTCTQLSHVRSVCMAVAPSP